VNQKENRPMDETRHFRRSESLAKLAEALAKAQGEIKGAAKDSDNPFFKSKYADLASIVDACRSPLAANGLAVMQFPRSTAEGVEVETLLAHSSGEWVAEILSLPVAKADAQGVGSAITYARRYALASMVGVAPEDDDGNAAVKSTGDLRVTSLKILTAAADKGTAYLEAAWKTLTADMRAACKNDLAAMKERAAKVTAAERQPGDTGAP
jgi:hypothetical protein